MSNTNYPLRAKLQKAEPYLLYFLAFCILSSSIESFNDDLVFKAGPERYGGFFGWLSWFSQNWGGRVVPQGLLVLILQLPDAVFTFINAGMWLVLLYYIDKCFNRSQLPSWLVMGIMALAVLLLIPPSVLSLAIFWKCANVLYLWGMALAFVALYPAIRALRGEEPSRLDMALAPICSFYVASFEQAGAFISAALVILVLVNAACEKKLQLPLVAHTVWTCAWTAFFCLLPGNAARSAIETLGQYQQFGMFSPVDKLLLSIAYAVGNLEAEMPVLLLLLACIACYGSWQLACGSRLLRGVSALSVAYFGLCVLAQIAKANTGNHMLGMGAFGLLDVSTTDFGVSTLQIAKETLNLCFVVGVGAVLASLPGNRSGASIFACYFGALATMAIMGFSPTFLASGPRPRFIGYLLLMCVALEALSVVWASLQQSSEQLAAADPPQSRPGKHSA